MLHQYDISYEFWIENTKSAVYLIYHFTFSRINFLILFE